MEPFSKHAYFEHKRTVKPEDLDELDHVNNAVYLRYVEDCARAHAEQKGFTLEAFKNSGVLPVVRRHEITYHAPATLGDTLVISTEVIQLGGAKAVRHNKVKLEKNDVLLVEVLTDWVWLDPESKRPKRVPQEVLTAFGFKD